MSERLAVKRTVFAFRNGNIAEVYQAPSRDARSSCGILSTSQRQTRIHRFHEYTEASSLKASQLRGYPSFVQTVWSRFSIDAHRFGWHESVLVKRPQHSIVVSSSIPPMIEMVFTPASAPKNTSFTSFWLMRPKPTRRTRRA